MTHKNESLIWLDCVEDAEKLVQYYPNLLAPSNLLVASDIRVELYLRECGLPYCSTWDYVLAEALDPIWGLSEQDAETFSESLGMASDVAEEAQIWNLFVFRKMLSAITRAQVVLASVCPQSVTVVRRPSRPMHISLDYGENDIAIAAVMAVARAMGIPCEIQQAQQPEQKINAGRLFFLKRVLDKVRSRVRRWLSHLAQIGRYSRNWIAWRLAHLLNRPRLLLVGYGNDAAHLSFLQAALRDVKSRVFCYLAGGGLDETSETLAYGNPIDLIPLSALAASATCEDVVLPDIEKIRQRVKKWRHSQTDPIHALLSDAAFDYQFESMIQFALDIESGIQRVIPQIRASSPSMLAMTFVGPHLWAARRLGIPVRVVQHGAHWEGSIYRIWAKNGPLLTWGEGMRSELVNNYGCHPDDLVVTGHLWLDPIWHLKKTAKTSVENRLDEILGCPGDSNNFIVCFITSTYWVSHHDLGISAPQYLDDLSQLPQIVDKIPNLILLVKTHPRGYEQDFLKHALDVAGKTDHIRFISDPRITLANVLLRSQAAILVDTITSGVFDAHILGVPVIWWNRACQPREFRQRKTYVSGPNVLKVQTADELVQALKQVTTPGGLRDTLINAGYAFLKEYLGESDGNASRRAAAHIEEALLRLRASQGKNPWI